MLFAKLALLSLCPRRQIIFNFFLRFLLQKLQKGKREVNKINDAINSISSIKMHLSFVVSLVAAAISGYIYSKSADEMAYLAAIALALSLLASLIVAPFYLKVAGVLLLWASKRKLDLSFYN